MAEGIDHRIPPAGQRDVEEAISDMSATATGLYRPPFHLGTPRLVFDRVLRSDPCAYCPLRPSATVDHVVARAAGGDNTAANIIGACGACNGEKGTRSLLVFLLERAAVGEVVDWLEADPDNRVPPAGRPDVEET